MYHRYVRNVTRKSFQLVNDGRYDEFVASCAPTVHHRFGGDHALDGQRHDREHLRRSLDRLGRLVPPCNSPLTTSGSPAGPGTPPSSPAGPPPPPTPTAPPQTPTTAFTSSTSDGAKHTTSTPTKTHKPSTTSSKPSPPTATPKQQPHPSSAEPALQERHRPPRKQRHEAKLLTSRPEPRRRRRRRTERRPARSRPPRRTLRHPARRPPFLLTSADSCPGLCIRNLDPE